MSPAMWDQTPQWEVWCDDTDSACEECSSFHEIVYDPETAAEKIDLHNAVCHPGEPPAVVS